MSWLALGVAFAGVFIGQKFSLVFGCVFVTVGLAIGVVGHKADRLFAEYFLNKKEERYALLIFTFVAALVRLWDITETPPGIWLDEGRSGWWAIQFLNGRSWWALPEAPEPLFSYLIGLVSKWFGFSLTVSCSTIAVCGTLTVVAIWWAFKPVFGSTISLLAAVCLCFSRWHILISRLGTCYGLLPLCFLLVIGFLFRAWKTNKPIYWILAGCALGLSLYSYVPARAFPVVLIGTFFLSLVKSQMDRQRRSGVALLFVAGSVIATPYLLHVIHSPIALWLRFQDIATPFATHPWSEGMHNLFQFLREIQFGGGHDLFLKYPWGVGAPLLGIIGSSLLILGLPMVLKSNHTLWNNFLFMWFASILATVVITGVSWVRIGSLLPLICIVQALGLCRLLGSRLGRIGVVGLLLAIAFQEGGGFFFSRLQSADKGTVDFVFRVGDRIAGNAIAALAKRTPVYFSPETGDPTLPSERFTASILFISYPYVRHFLPRELNQLKRDKGLCVALVTSQLRREVVEEIFPGGKLVTIGRAPGAMRVPSFYIMNHDIEGLLTLREYKYLFARLGHVTEHIKANRWKPALQILDPLIERWPHVGELYLQRALALMVANKRKADTFNDLERAVKLTRGKNSRALAVLGGVHANSGDISGAIGMWKQSLEIYAMQETVWYSLVVAYMRIGERSQALRVLERGLRVFPQSNRLRELIRQIS